MLPKMTTQKCGLGLHENHHLADLHKHMHTLLTDSPEFRVFSPLSWCLQVMDNHFVRSLIAQMCGGGSTAS